jgi:hypothetical protein
MLRRQELLAAGLMEGEGWWCNRMLLLLFLLLLLQLHCQSASLKDTAAHVCVCISVPVGVAIANALHGMSMQGGFLAACCCQSSLPACGCCCCLTLLCLLLHHIAAGLSCAAFEGFAEGGRVSALDRQVRRSNSSSSRISCIFFAEFSMLFCAILRKQNSGNCVRSYCFEQYV